MKADILTHHHYCQMFYEYKKEDNRFIVESVAVWGDTKEELIANMIKEGYEALTPDNDPDFKKYHSVRPKVKDLNYNEKVGEKKPC